MSESSTEVAADAPVATPEAGLREDQIQNAVSFLSHPKVSPSPESSKRDFLQKKGLTEAEIAEAFRRVPQMAAPAPAPAPATAPAPAPAYAPAPAPAQQIQYAPVPVQGQQQYLGQPQYAPQPPPPQPRTWGSLLVSAGFVAASAYCLKVLVWPYVFDAAVGARDAINARREAKEGAQGERKDAARGSELAGAGELAAAIREQTEELRASVNALKTVAERVERSTTDAQAGALTAADLRAELKSFAAAIKESAAPTSGALSPELRAELREIKGLLKRGRRVAAELSEDEGAAADASQEGAGGVETGLSRRVDDAAVALVSSITSGEAPEADRAASGELDDLLIRPEQEIPEAVRKALAEADQALGGAIGAYVDGGTDDASAGHGEGSAGEETSDETRASPAAASGPEAAPSAKAPGQHPSSYMQVLEMLERGETPPGIRTDIDDKPADASATPAPSRIAPKPKPWERALPIEATAGEGPAPVSRVSSIVAATATTSGRASQDASAGDAPPTNSPEGSVADAASRMPYGSPGARDAAGPGPSPNQWSPSVSASAPAPGPNPVSPPASSVPTPPASSVAGSEGSPSLPAAARRPAGLFEAASAPLDHASSGVLVGLGSQTPPRPSGGVTRPSYGSLASAFGSSQQAKGSDAAAGFSSGFGTWKPPPIPQPSFSGSSSVPAA